MNRTPTGATCDRDNDEAPPTRCAPGAWTALAAAALVVGCASTPSPEAPSAPRTAVVGAVQDPPEAIPEAAPETVADADGDLESGDDRADFDPDTDSMSPAREAIAAELGSALGQLIRPETRSVQIDREDGAPIAGRYAEAMLGEGLGVRYVSGDTGAWFVSYGRLQENRGQWSYRLSAGPVSVSRTYEIDGASVVATSPLQVAGTRNPVEIQAGGIPTSTFASRVAYTGAASPAGRVPVIRLLDRDFTRIGGLGEGGAPLPSETAVNDNQVEVRNVFFDAAPFESIETTHQQGPRHIVIFGDDSLAFGADNRLLLDRFVDARVSDGDLLAIVGCSNGPTRSPLGNEGLALGRAAAVVEALVARGISRSRVRDEGCWAPTPTAERYPGRGVVVDVWRPRGQG